MLFHSQVFLLIFLPVVLAFYYALAGRTRVREWMLVLASLTFYAWWDVRFLPLLLAQVLVSWVVAEVGAAWRLRWFFWAGVVLNLAVLATFKYVDFFVASMEAAMGVVLPRANLILPIGISFYTFQIVSYLLDCTRENAPRYDLRRFALFVTLFPQLVAGPIVRHNEIVPQFYNDPLREGLYRRLATGGAIFILALLAKVFIADRLAAIVDPIFAASERGIPDMADAWVGVVGFGFQIFFDFAAYSEMAIGVALMMGFVLPANFRQPYRAANLRDFWRRWHMTLSRFLRDYLYIPLGGSRHGWPHYVMAALVTMGLCGLWHGAGWTFVIWGLAHGIGLVVHRAWSEFARPMPALLGWAITFAFAVLLFGLFRATSFESAANLAEAMVAGGTAGGLPGTGQLGLIAVAGLIALQPLSGQELVEKYMDAKSWVAIALACLLVFTALEVGKGQPQSFIYFQF